MKNKVFWALTLLFFAFQSNGQPSGTLWVGSRSPNPAANAVHTVLASANAALAVADFDKWLEYCTSDVTLANQGSDRILTGKTAIQEAFANLSPTPADSPKYRYENVQVRLLSSDVALSIWGIARISDNAKSQGTATLRKVNGKWKIELCVCDLAEMLG